MLSWTLPCLGRPFAKRDAILGRVTCLWRPFMMLCGTLHWLWRPFAKLDAISGGGAFEEEGNRVVCVNSLLTE